jgi:hypothetical protein
MVETAALSREILNGVLCRVLVLELKPETRPE